MKPIVRIAAPARLHSWVFSPPIPKNIRAGSTGIVEVRSNVLLFKPRRLYAHCGTYVLQVKIDGKVQPDHERWRALTLETIFNVDGVFDYVEQGMLIEFDLLFERADTNGVALIGTAKESE